MEQHTTAGGRTVMLYQSDDLLDRACQVTQVLFGGRVLAEVSKSSYCWEVKAPLMPRPKYSSSETRDAALVIAYNCVDEIVDIALAATTPAPAPLSDDERAEMEALIKCWGGDNARHFTHYHGDPLGHIQNVLDDLFQAPANHRLRELLMRDANERED